MTQDALKARLVSAMQLHVQGKLTEAQAAYESLLEQWPNHPDILYALARVLAQSGKTEQAMDTLATLLSVNPKQEAQVMFFTLCRALGNAATRLSCLEAYPESIRGETFYAEYGKALKDNGRFNECFAMVQEAIEKYPASLSLLRLRANVCLSLSRHDQALEDAKRIVALAPDDHYARTSLGSLQLLLSGCTEGFADYAHHHDHVAGLRNIHLPIAQWRGEPVRGKRLLVWASQGIGDIVMFASLLPWLTKEGATLTIAVYPKLTALFARSFSQATIIACDSELLMQQACDYHTVFGQMMEYVLPHYTPAKHPPFLKADAARAKNLREKYQALFPGKKLVGISWNTTNPETFSERNIPLSLWAPILALPHVQCISLQYGDHAADIAKTNIYADVDIDAYHDVDGLAAQIAALDEVVSIQNSTIHLAGALGMKTTILLSTASEWRWGLKRSDNLWYGSVHVERQQTMLEWPPVILRLASRL